MHCRMFTKSQAYFLMHYTAVNCLAMSAVMYRFMHCNILSFAYQKVKSAERFIYVTCERQWPYMFVFLYYLCVYICSFSLWNVFSLQL